MRQIIQNMKNGLTEIVDVPIPKIQPGYILVKTGASLVSSGTERMLVEFAEKNLVGKAKSRPDLFKQVLQKAQRDGILATLESAFNRLDQAIVLGYSSSGTIVEIGKEVDQFSVGDRVVCAGGGYAVHAEYALVPKNLAAKLPDSVTFEEGAFATIGSIALNGIRIAHPQIGEKSAVIGLGLLGLLTSQLLKASGLSVVGLDLNPDKTKLANNFGIEAFTNEFVGENYLQITNGLGFDHVFICADTVSNQPVELAGEIARDRGNIIAIGAVGMDIPRKPYYEKELTFKVSRSYGPGRYDSSYEENGNDYPEGYVRWTEGRNIANIIELIASKKIDVEQLISHRFEISDATDAYQLLTGKTKEKYLGLIINYPQDEKYASEKRYIDLSNVHKESRNSGIKVGVIGAGNYANAVFLPIIHKHPQTVCFGVASAHGLNAQQSARKYRSQVASSEEMEIIKHEDIDIAVILTRHDSHASLVQSALENGKHVYCENPLAINKAEISGIIEPLGKEGHPYLTVGFNRRFAPFVNEIKKSLVNNAEPIYAHYRINAGYLPQEHWLHNSESGGGRLIGEGCHFIDLMLFLIGSTPIEVNTQLLPNSGKYKDDNFLITIHFSDGSLASLSYLSNGSRSASKEYLELFTGGKTIIMHDFKKLQIFNDSVTTKHAFLKQDKGHKAAWDAFIHAITQQAQPPISYEALLQTTYVTLACAESMHEKTPINIEKFIDKK